MPETSPYLLLIFYTLFVQRSLHKRGLTLYELAEHLVHDLHLEYAINLDGGSSSVLIDRHGKVKNHPTCLDVVPYKCERPVATVFCLGHKEEGADDESHRIKTNEE